MHGASRIGPTKQARTLARGGVIAGSLLASAMTGSSTAQCAGDIFDDGLVNGGDLGVMLTYWGPTTESPASQRCDLDANGIVDGGDLGVLLANWGACITVPGWATSLEAQPDPSIVTDPAIRAAIIATRLPWRVRDTATGIEMMLVPPGTFAMGCTATTTYSCPPAEGPVHQVVLDAAFYLGRFEVTQAQWTATMGSNPSAFQGDADAPLRPVDSVDWVAARGFAERVGMRLPTEAEWEFTCRAGTSKTFHGSPIAPGGSDDPSYLSTIAWYGDGSGAGKPKVVGLKAPNGLGFHDISGNVWEWTNDWFGSSYYGSSPVLNPTGPSTGSYRVARGGGFTDQAFYSRASHRHTIQPGGSALYTVGLRVARNP